ncbi:trypsin-like peptidase domain-containing protein [Myroides albus]|uniref:PDZ domain-containing protein n=1 Tax=Myroides albus TaxID=2562892 RepID=A0A6I3LH60_9FLAO|nr:trypsin-like peptidase domain-containing protein [Myroides albus]MTG97167.1 PDZ domain-containing protein [Myroides albus]UVD78909.1 trypsin-like peptidase domain-containing protein [Myroides albus]
MKKTISLLFLCIFSGAITLGGYKYFFENKSIPTLEQTANSEHTLPLKTSSIAGSAAPTDFTQAAENTVNAVVHVKNLSYTRTRSNSLLEFFYGYKGETQAQVGMGSGVIITEDGYIVTNNHVIANASELEVTLNDNQTYKAKLIGTDKQMDIALLKIEADKKLPYLVFGDSDNLRLGEWVIAVGNPFNLTSTVTTGIVSAKARNLSKSGIQSFIQTDAVINPGNSGGALVNTRGELIGINTMISSNTGSYVGYAFAVPSNITKKIIEDLLEYGDVQQAVLGVSGLELNNLIAKDLKIEQTHGFYIQDVVKQSDAEKVGLTKGDIITQINSKPIKTFVDIKSILNTKRPQDKVEVTYIRNGQSKTDMVALIKAQSQQVSYNGFEFEEITEQERERLKINYGLKITKVDNPNYAPYKDELEQGILLSINGQRVQNTAQAKMLFDKIVNSQKIKLEVISSSGELIRILL